MNEKLFNETFFKKNNYFRKDLNLSSEQLNEYLSLVKNWQKNCENYNPDTDKESTDENEFIDIVFKKILGYNGKGIDSEQYELYPKYKIEGAGITGNAGFVDLALGNWGVIQVLVEFKDQRSNNLDRPSNRKDKLSPVNQCWNYLNHCPNAKWGIVTNFNEIRLYHKNKGQNVYEVFYFNVPEEYKDKYQPLSVETELLKFILIFKKDHLLSKNQISYTEELLKTKGIEETRVQKEFYLVYKALRTEIFYESLRCNLQYETERPKSELLQLVQKLLDRILFCWFCEDSRENLIPSNVLSVDLIQTHLKDKYYNPEHFNIYGNVKSLFQAIDEGRGFGIEKGYNGELFKPDSQLDALKIPNFLFEKISDIGMKYDFGDENELNVNILGHIFEQSISDLEEMRVSFQELDQSPKKQDKQQVMEFAKEAEVVEHKHLEFDAKKTRRKKEGVYYTPESITNYIVENTIGVWLQEKWELCNTTSKKKLSENEVQYNRLKMYRDEYLSKIKVLDPACGSGAFLIAAFNYLWKEQERVYNEICELRAKQKVTTNKETMLFDFDSVQKTILENNLYGVDLNSESVEITKLSLWLKTAVKNKKLNNLANNIKVGNSLIDDPNVAGELAFDWKKEFPEVFDRRINKLKHILKAESPNNKKSGFDIVIGNPPYVSNWTLSNHNREMVLSLEQKYQDWLTGHWDIFICFVARSIELLNSNGFHSFILPTSFLKEKHSKSAREKLLSSYRIASIVDFGEKVIFENVARQTMIYVISKEKHVNNEIKIRTGIKGDEIKIPQLFFYNLKNSSIKTIVQPTSIKIYEKMQHESILLGRLVCINTGVVAHSKIGSSKKFKKDSVIHNKSKEDYKKYIVGSNIRKYYLYFDNQYIDYNSNINNFHRPKYPLLFESPKIIVRRISGPKNSIIAYYDEDKYYSNDNLIHLVLWNNDILKYQKPENKWEIVKKNDYHLKYILAILCSKLCSYFFSKFLSTDTLQGSYSGIYPEDLRVIPIKVVSKKQQKPFINLADLMLSKNKELQEVQKKFLTLLVSEFKIEKLSGKLEEWYLLQWSEFASELAKKKIKLSTKDEEKWLDRFDRLKKEAIAMKGLIDSTDKQIDQLVYELYELTKEEIELIEKQT